jgi:hypothetical protein
VCSGRDGSYSAICGARKKAARVKEVLRTELPERPTESGFELDSEKIPDFAENTVTNAPLQLPFGVADAQSGVYRNRRIHLNACARQRNIFQIRDCPTNPAVFIFPTDIDQIGTKHPRLGPAVMHTLVLIGAPFESFSANWGDETP